MSTTMQEIQKLMKEDPIDRVALAELLDDADHPQRVAAIRTFTGKQQANLWDACMGHSTSLEDLVPPEHPAATEVIHVGRNSLPAFRDFEKRFSRDEARDDAVYGYNEGATRPLIGPGYFVAHLDENRNEIGVDYLMVPPDGANLPDDWPTVVPNERGLQRFVYAGMVDYLRRTSDHVLIGRAWRKGRVTSNYFVLCRTP